MPHLGCARPCCAGARARGLRLGPVSLGIRDRRTGAGVLVEATPEIDAQLTRWAGGDGARAIPLDAVLITHAHMGHYFGLAWLGREVAHARGLAVYGTARLAAFLAANGPWSQLVELGEIRPVAVEPEIPFEPVPGLRVIAHRVPHREEFTDCVAFRFLGPSRTVLFCPDIDRWDDEPGLVERLLRGADVAFLDGTFYDGAEVPGRDAATIPHPLMVDTMGRLGDFAAARPGAVRFIHLNHSNPALWDEDLRKEIRSRGFELADEGSRLDL